MDSLRRYPAADVVVDQARSWLSTVGEEPYLFVATPDGPSSPLLSSGGCAASIGASHITAGRARFLNSFWNRGDIGTRRLQRYRGEILSFTTLVCIGWDKQLSRLVPSPTAVSALG